MSGIYISGMEMPTCCYTCPCADLEYFDCNLLLGTRIEQHRRLDNCPLVPVPEHGRLIDADALEKIMSEGIAPSVKDGGFKHPFDIIRAVANAPTIIPADPSKEGE